MCAVKIIIILILINHLGNCFLPMQSERPNANISHANIQRHDSHDELFVNPPRPNHSNSPLNGPMNNNVPALNNPANNENQNVNIIINNVQVPAPNPHPPGVNNANAENYKKTLIECFWNLLFMHLTAIFFITKFIFNTHYGLVFFILFTHDFYELHLIIPKMRRKSYLVFFSEKLLTIITQALVLIYLETHAFFLTLATIPLICLFLLRLLKYSMDKYLKDCQSILDFFSIGFKLFLFLQGVTIFCKMDTFLTWDWSEVFWPYWVLFSVLIGINFGMFFMFLSKFCQLIWAHGNWMEFKGILWMEIICISFTIITSITVVTLSSYLDGSTDNSGLFFVFYALITSFCINSIILFSWKKDLMEFLATSADESSQEDQENSQINKSNNKQQPNWIINNAIPRFLTKFSSTYFKKAEITSAYLKEKIKNKKKKNAQSKDAMKAVFANKKSHSFSNFDKKMMGVENSKNYKLKEKDHDNIKGLIKPKQTKFDIEKLNVIKHDHEQSPHSGDVTLEIRNSYDKSPHKEDFILLEHEKFILPNQISTIQEEISPSIPPKHGGDSPAVSSSNKLPHKMSLNIHVIKSNRKDSDEKQFPNSATLPMRRNISNLLDQIRKQSGQDLNSPGQKLKKNSESNLNQNCLVCFDKPPNAVFMNCGHGGICYECALEIFKTNKECYLCRTKIHQVLQIDTNVIAGDYIKVIQGIKMPSIIE